MAAERRGSGGRSEFERFEGNVLGGDEELAGEGGFRRTALEGFLGGDANEIRIVVLLGDVGHNEIAGARVETLGIAEEFADGMIGEMAGAGEDALLDDPGVRADLEHVEIVIGFEDEAVGVAKMDADVIGHEAEIGADGDLVTVGAEGEADGVDGVVGNAEGVDVNVTDGEGLAGFDGFDAMEALAEGFGEDAAEGAHGGLGNIERGFP